MTGARHRLRRRRGGSQEESASTSSLLLHQQPPCAFHLGGGVRPLVRPGPKGLAHAVYRCRPDSRVAPHQSSSHLRLAGPGPTMAALLPGPVARLRAGAARPGRCQIPLRGAQGMARARARARAPSASSQTLASMHASALAFPPLPHRCLLMRHGRLRSPMPWRAPRPDRPRCAAAGGRRSEPGSRARRDQQRLSCD
jgi:hypothetical protein